MSKPKANTNVHRRGSEVQIGGETGDKHARYRRPHVMLKTEGKGGGTKTVLVNLPEMAAALHRPADMILACLATLLGTRPLTLQTEQKKTINHTHRNRQAPRADVRWALKGLHSVQTVERALQQFEQRFVLCAECKSPEMVLRVDPKDDGLQAHCPASGHSYDVRDKLVPLVIKTIKGKKNSQKEPVSLQPYCEDASPPRSRSPSSGSRSPSPPETKWASGTSEEDVERRRQEEFKDSRPSAKGLLTRFPHLIRPSPDEPWQNKSIVWIHDILMYSKKEALDNVSQTTSLLPELVQLISSFLPVDLIDQYRKQTYEYDVWIGVDALSEDEAFIDAQMLLVCAFYRWLSKSKPCSSLAKKSRPFKRTIYVLSISFAEEWFCFQSIENLENPEDRVSCQPQ